GVELYPNPANSVVNVKTDVLFETLEVTNMLGQLIYSAPVTGNQFQINISGYNAGVYFIKLSGSAGSAVKKVVKN
ncbi:MAG: T9SS type A sorting domain-containing protein, partial [Bacteroidales bacterium]|nr:T9SS type A sorting domain-containing protein [Bacteroidales bacterium]